MVLTARSLPLRPLSPSKSPFPIYPPPWGVGVCFNPNGSVNSTLVWRLPLPTPPRELFPERLIPGFLDFGDLIKRAFAEASVHGLPPPRALAFWPGEEAGRRQEPDATPPASPAPFFSSLLPAPSGRKQSRDLIARCGRRASTNYYVLLSLPPSFAPSARLPARPGLGRSQRAVQPPLPPGLLANHVVPGISRSSGSCVTLCPGLN